MSDEARKAAAEKIYPTGYWWHGRFVVAPPGSQFKDCPSPGDALAGAKSLGRSVRDFTGGLNHPCGCGVGRNLLGEIPYGPCQEHGGQSGQPRTAS